jgi:quinol-cytochrome oxidoreductase complex cytochrome b subunit/coenzyme F420-reducing hydrogenase delta subunit
MTPADPTLPTDTARPAPRSATERAWRALERQADRVFGAAANPLRQLGALAVLMIWIALASGTYLYIVFDTSAAGAHASLDDLARDQPWVGGLVRSLHRYSADAFVLLTALHVGREWLLGRYAGFRWFSWVSGVPLLWLALLSGLVGYWMVADTRALFVATAIADWTGWLPGFGDALSRNFIAEEAISDRLFALLVFIHIFAALLVLAGLWVHIKRIARPVTQPARQVAAGGTVMLVALAAVWPALSTAPADFARVPQAVPVDWFFFWLFPLMYATSPGTLWAVTALGTLLLAVLPWTTRAPRPAAAVVDLAHCNGCRRCFDDCPFSAIALVPRSDGRPYPVQPEVDADLCAGCGICVGSCPSSLPFRARARLVTGIDLPGRPLTALRDTLRQALAAQPGAAVLFGCDEGARVDRLAAPGVITLSLPCVAMLPPAFADYALRQGAARVVVASCGRHGCAYRLGGGWVEDRLAGRRQPVLRERARGPRVRLVEALRGDEGQLRSALREAAPERVPHPEAGDA